MIVKNWTLQWLSCPICRMRPRAFMRFEEVRRDGVEGRERVNCFVHGAERQINRLDGAEPKI